MTDTSGLKTWVVTVPGWSVHHIDATSKSAAVQQFVACQPVIAENFLMTGGITFEELPEMVEVRKEDLREALTHWGYAFVSDGVVTAIDRLRKAAGLEGKE